MMEQWSTVMGQWHTDEQWSTTMTVNHCEEIREHGDLTVEN